MKLLAGVLHHKSRCACGENNSCSANVVRSFMVLEMYALYNVTLLPL